MRLDIYLAEKGLAQSRTFAKMLISKGCVTVNNKAASKPSYDVADGDDVAVISVPYSFVSRGGVKLEAALEHFKVDVQGAVCVDIGASSGGFTDCLLSRGAAKVFAVDSGSGQLAEKLRADTRVINIENFNARELSADTLGEKPDIAVCDVSFISQTLIIPAAARVLKDGGVYIGLIKPQFECGRAGLGKGGIVKDKKVMTAAIEKVTAAAAASRLGAVDIIPSPIFGGDGNREFLMLAKSGECGAPAKEQINKVVYSLEYK